MFPSFYGVRVTCIAISGTSTAFEVWSAGCPLNLDLRIGIPFMMATMVIGMVLARVRRAA
jgi:hypothetical protein